MAGYGPAVTVRVMTHAGTIFDPGGIAESSEHGISYFKRSVIPAIRP
jgi:hypothetical protein